MPGRLSESGGRARVLIAYKFMPQWRVGFFDGLRSSLADRGIDLDVVYGKTIGRDAEKNDEVELSWGRHMPNSRVKVGRLELLWQPCLREARKHDLVIAEQADRLLLNYALMALRRVTPMRFALWGHGLDLSSRPRSLRNRFKRARLSQCDWWFAYTEQVRDFVVQEGFPEEHVTVVQNAIDTTALSRWYEDVSAGELVQLRDQLQLGPGPVAIFCGGMHKLKRLDLVISTCDQIRMELTDFHILFLGEGPELNRLVEAAKTRDWMHVLGARFGQERAKYFKLADIMLMPSWVGLGILDCFATETPLVTVKANPHPPEVAYLRSGHNGVLVPEMQEYAAATIRVLNDKQMLQHLKAGCRLAAKRYTLEAMVENFSSGVVQALEITN